MNFIFCKVDSLSIFSLLRLHDSLQALYAPLDYNLYSANYIKYLYFILNIISIQFALFMHTLSKRMFYNIFTMHTMYSINIFHSLLLYIKLYIISYNI